MYITQSNLNKLIAKVEIDFGEILDLPDIRAFLSQAEIEQLSKAHKFFAFHDKIVLTYLQEVKVPADTYTMLFEGIPPAYHIDKYCKKLNNPYKNLYIPAEIIARGYQEVNRFRDYVNKNFNFEDLNKEATFLTIKAHFGFADPHFTTISKDNTGMTEVDFLSLSLDEVNGILQQSIYSLNNFANQSDEHRKVFKLIYRSPKDIERLTKKHDNATIAKELSHLKHQLLLSKTAFLHKSNNFKQESINKSILQQHGFVPCSCVWEHQRKNLF